MIDPSLSDTRLTAMNTYAQLAEPQYDIPPGGTPAMEAPEYQNGVIPLDTLPAAWWNWMWKTITEQEKRMCRFFSSIFGEFQSLLTAGNINSFSEVVTNQLTQAIQTIARTPASTTTRGAILSSASGMGTVQVNETTGVATVNGMGSTALDTISQTVTAAINELNTAIGDEASARGGADNTLQNNINQKANISHATDQVNADTGLAINGQGSSTEWGHVKVTDAYTAATPGTAADGMAVSQKALVDGLASVVAGQASVLIGSLTLYAGDITNGAPHGYLPCDGRAVSRTDYSALFGVIGTTWGQGDGTDTFNIPDLREAAPVGIGQRASGSATHDEFTLGQYKDDQLQNHGHSASSSLTIYDTVYNQYPSDYGLYAGRNNTSHTVTPAVTVSNPNSGRRGDVTRGKRVGVNYLIYAGV